jgi:hypothetical protein
MNFLAHQLWRFQSIFLENAAFDYFRIQRIRSFITANGGVKY